MASNDAYTQLEKAIVYVCHSFKENPLKLGSVKLNKILWFSDVQSLRERRKTITGIHIYVAQNLGPVLSDIPSAMQGLYYKGIISSMRADFIDFQQWVYTIMDELKAQLCIEELGEEDKKILDEWVEYAQNHTVREIVKKAHSYSWWNKYDIGNPIPVQFVLEQEK